MEGVLPRMKYEERLECTTNRISSSKLGKVGYLCRDLPIYELQTMAPPVTIHTGKRRKSVKYHLSCNTSLSKLST